MTKNVEMNVKAHTPFVMALHSSSKTLGVAVVDSREPIISRRSATFQVGRELSNNLFECIEHLWNTDS